MARINEMKSKGGQGEGTYRPTQRKEGDNPFTQRVAGSKTRRAEASVVLLQIKL